ncbi:MAG TPA: DUF4231 domain-containing protein [Pyrinomonadaceae bacterium]|nr:DUF4231 domain-containing protein [Pyrinomonadaceae bacterium]
MSLPNAYHGASYRAWLNEDLSAMIESKELGLSNLHKNYLRSRWLEQVLRMEYKSNRAARMYYALRLITVIGCIFILMLVSLKIDDQRWATWAVSVRYLTISLSLLVSISVAVEHLFNYGERLWQYQRIVERLKSEGWRFLQLSGRYRHYASHSEAFPLFANQVEALSQREAEVSSPEVVRERVVEEEHGGVESPKKLDLLPKENGQSAATRTTMRDVVTRHLNQQRMP